jgi:hypothetical protein
MVCVIIARRREKVNRELRGDAGDRRPLPEGTAILTFTSVPVYGIKYA